MIFLIPTELRYRAEVKIYNSLDKEFETVQLVYVDNLKDLEYYIRKYIDNPHWNYNLDLELFRRSVPTKMKGEQLFDG